MKGKIMALLAGMVLLMFEGYSQAARPGVVLEEFLYTSAPFPSCHAVTMVELQNKELLATYFGGTAERNPDVEIRLQRKKTDGTWTAPISVADGVQPDGKRFPTWNPVIFQPKGGDLMLYYKVGPTPREWWGEFKTSTDNGYTWSKGQKLPGNLLGPIKNKPIQLPDGTILSGSSTENAGWVAHVSGLDAVTLTNGRQLLVYNHATHDQKETGHNGRGIINVAVSKDGANWEAALILDYSTEPDKEYSYPSIIQTSDGLVHVIYTWNRTRIKHVVIDPNKLVTFPIKAGKWPFDKIPLMKSSEK